MLTERARVMRAKGEEGEEVVVEEGEAEVEAEGEAEVEAEGIQVEVIVHAQIGPNHQVDGTKKLPAILRKVAQDQDKKRPIANSCLKNKCLALKEVKHSDIFAERKMILKKKTTPMMQMNAKVANRYNTSLKKTNPKANWFHHFLNTNQIKSHHSKCKLNNLEGQSLIS